MLNDPRSHGLWELTAPAAPQTEQLAGDLTADVVVVGAGFCGLSTALHLAERGVNVAVMEATEIGFGAAGRNVGLVNGGMWVMPDDIPKVLGPQHGERALRLLGDAPLLVRDVVDKYEIDCELERNGTLHLAVGDAGVSELRERHRQWTARGAPLELLDARETQRRVGSSAYAASLFDPRAGTIQPLAYVRGLAKAAIQNRVRIFTNSPALRTERSGVSWKVSSSRGSISGKWIIVATDAYSVGPWAAVRREQVHLPYFNLATPPLSANLRASILPGLEGCWDTKEILSSFRMDRKGRLVFGSVGALRNGGHAVHTAWAKRAMSRIFPQLANIEFEAAWYGKIGMTSDAVPRFHEFDENIVGFSGFNGRGIAPGTTFGKTLAAFVSGDISLETMPLPSSKLETSRIRVLQESYYEAGAQIAHLATERF